MNPQTLAKVNRVLKAVTLAVAMALACYIAYAIKLFMQPQ
jgi:hypothetical protein